jgi:hypothetical protein
MHDETRVSEQARVAGAASEMDARMACTTPIGPNDVDTMAD